jgi:hypothetical protein
MSPRKLGGLDRRCDHRSFVVTPFTTTLCRWQKISSSLAYSQDGTRSPAGKDENGRVPTAPAGPARLTHGASILQTPEPDQSPCQRTFATIAMTQPMQQTTFTSTFHVSPQLLAAFMIFILTSLTYIDILNHQFVDFDDKQIILPRSETFNTFTLQNIKNIILEDYPREEPLIVRDLSYLINGSIFGGDNPQGYLLGNLLLHMLVCYLVFSLSLLLFPDRYWQAIITAILFAVHPIHVESVAWISSRKDTLYSSFFLASLLSYSQFVKTNSSTRLTISFALYLLALFSKTSAIAFIPMALLYRLLFASHKKWGWREGAYFVLLAVSSVRFMQWYSGELAEFGVFQLQNAPALIKENPAQWLLLNMEVITFYLGKLLYPQTLANTYFYPAPQLLFIYLPALLLSMAACAVLLFALLKFIRMTDKRPLFLALWFLVALGPYLNWAGINIFVADRYLYLASFAPLAAAGYLLTTLTTMIRHQDRTTTRNLAILLICLLVTVMVARGIKAVAVWSSSETLWRNALRVTPLRLEPYINLLELDIDRFNQNQQTPEGYKALQQAKTIANQAYRTFCNNGVCSPNVTDLLGKIAHIYYLEDNMTKAEQFLNQGLLLKPEDIYLNFLHTYVKIKQGDIPAAQEDIEFITRHAHPYIHAGILADIKDNIPRIIAEKLTTQQ